MSNSTTTIPGDGPSWHSEEARNYDNRRFTTSEGRFIQKFEEQLILNVLRKHQVRSVLDVPAGTGRLTIPIAKEFDTAAADISADMLSEAKQKAVCAKLDAIEWKVADVANLPFADRYFDAVCTARLFQHVPTEMAPAIVNELMRVIKSNGILVVQFRSGLYGGIINFVKYFLIKRTGRIRNKCIFPGQVRQFFGSRRIVERMGYKFPGSGRLARVFGDQTVAFANRFCSRIPLVRWLGAYITFVVVSDE